MLPEFAADLLNNRPLRVAPPGQLGPGEVSEAMRVLHDFEQEFRLELPGEPPDYDAAAAEWGLTSLYFACSLAVHRDAGVDVIQALLNQPAPGRSRAESHYAVDLSMRFLPDLVKLAKRAASDDPLVAKLMTWAKDWPLSSVGIAGVGKVDAAPLRTSPALLRLYVDRIMAAGDAKRLDDPAVRDAAAAALGDYRSLSPKIADALQENPDAVANTPESPERNDA